jgi:hypothetical protein
VLTHVDELTPPPGIGFGFELPQPAGFNADVQL